MSNKSKVTERKKQKKADEHFTLLTDFDIHLFRQGRHYHLYNKLGAHYIDAEERKGVFFAVWAPNAESVSVIGEFNDWNNEKHPMRPRWDSSGIWEIFIPGMKKGTLYKYHIRSRHHGYTVDKADPFAFHAEEPPKTASVVTGLEYKWKDKEWMQQRLKEKGEKKPVAVYELHPGSWKRVPEEDNRYMTYGEMAEELPEYLDKMGYTHVELMPVMEHPFYGSWGYQITGYFAPTSRYGTPQEFMQLVDALHKKEIGVILDWVPSHFPSDEHGLAYFDGTHLYEHADPRKGYHPDWNSYIFNYGRNEIRSFLISNALFWLDKYHVDGLRVDAVASMLYLDYSRKEGEWLPNEYGGRENLDAISLLKEFNEAVYNAFPDVHTIAEESTAWPMVSKPVYIGGLGFGMKWMMGWMHDTLDYMQKEPVYRKHHQDQITFSIYYAFHENFVLPLSHDEVVHGKGSLLGKMPGDEWQKFANLRILYSYMYAHPGKKMLFMGGEIGQGEEWDHESSLNWHLLDYHYHSGIQRLCMKLNEVYRAEPALYEQDFEQTGFDWVDIHDAENSVISFVRKSINDKEQILIICNFTPVPRYGYRAGVPVKGKWKEIFNSDSDLFSGSNVVNPEPLEPANVPAHGKEQSVSVTLPPLGVVYFKLEV